MTQLTKYALEAALKTLLSKKPLDKITISDLTEECGISRMTFYYHFRDIYDLVEWICAEDAAKAIAGKKTYETWQQGFLQIFEAVRENRPFILNVYRCVSTEQVERYLYPLVYRLLIDVVEEKAQAFRVKESDRRFIANFYKFGFVGVMLEWIKNDMREDPEKIVSQLNTLLSGEIERALERFSIP